jgi:sporulation protein YlmC with PRC-barrel domain
MLLTELIGREVVTADGREVGRVTDVGVELSEAKPLLSRLVVRPPRGAAGELAWDGIDELGPPVRLKQGLEPGVPVLDREDELLLVAHVLDRQIFDSRGMRLRRVGDLELEAADGGLRLVAAEVGIAALLRRLGVARLTRAPAPKVVDWAEIHIASGPGHAIQLGSGSAGIHRLSPEQVVALAARLPAHRADDVLGAARASRGDTAWPVVSPAAQAKRRRGPLHLRRRAPS